MHRQWRHWPRYFLRYWDRSIVSPHTFGMMYFSECKNFCRMQCIAHYRFEVVVESRQLAVISHQKPSGSGQNSENSLAV